MNTTTARVRHGGLAIPARLRNGGIVILAGLLAILLGLRAIAPVWLYALLLAVFTAYLVIDI